MNDTIYVVMDVITEISRIIAILMIIVFIVICIKRSFFDKKQSQEQETWKVTKPLRGRISFLCGCVSLICLVGGRYSTSYIDDIFFGCWFLLMSISLVFLFNAYLKKERIQRRKALFWIIFSLLFIRSTVAVSVRYFSYKNEYFVDTFPVSYDISPCPQPACYYDSDDSSYCPRVFC